MKRLVIANGQSPSDLISKRIADLGDWRGVTLDRMRTLILQADPDAVEEWKWMGTPICHTTASSAPVNRTGTS
jgi:hypothetical protein